MKTVDKVGETGRSILINHVLSRRVKYVIKISADELTKQTARDFMENFFFAKIRYMSLDPSPTTPADSTFMPVENDDEELNESYLRGNKFFPEQEFELIEKYPRTWNSSSKKWEPYTLP